MELARPYKYKNTYITRDIPAGIFKDFPYSIEWRGVTLFKKDEFHVTVCRGEDIFAATGQMAPDAAERKLLSLFIAFVKNKPINVLSFLDDFRYAEDERGRKSVLVRCQASNLDDFFAQLNDEFDIAMPVQPPHITLYTSLPNLGIHIPSEKVMGELPPINLPSLEVALKKIKQVSV